MSDFDTKRASELLEEAEGFLKGTRPGGEADQSDISVWKMRVESFLIGYVGKDSPYYTHFMSAGAGQKIASGMESLQAVIKDIKSWSSD